LQPQSAGQNEENRELTRRMLARRGDLLINTLRAGEARANYRAAMELTTSPNTRAYLAQHLAFSLLQIGHGQDACNLCEDALQSLAEDNSPEAVQLRVQLSRVLVRACIAIGRLDEAEALCQEALAMAHSLQIVKPSMAAKISAGANQGLGLLCRRQGRDHEARIYFERAVEHARSAALRNEEAEALALHSSTLRDLGDFDGAEESGQAALDVAQAVGNDYLAARVLHHLSVTSYFHNELALALARSQQAAALQRQIGDPDGMVSCDILQAVVYTGTGEMDKAIAAATRARRDGYLLDNRWLMGTALYICGTVHTIGGNLPFGEAALREALEIEDFVKDLPMRESARIMLGMNAVSQGNLAEVQRIEGLLAGNIAVEIELLGGLFRGMAAIAAGDQAKAESIANATRKRAQESGYWIYAVEAGQLLLAAQNPPPLDQLVGFVCLPRSAHSQS
jgi:tetratricopeptide (TPR) repeat protein